MTKKILLIDDSTTQLVSLKMFIQKAGYQVITANNGVEGISAVYQSFPDLIVSDILMPEINGYQLCRLLKNDQMTKNIPIILLTSLNEKIDEFWGLKAGAEAFRSKEKDLDGLLDLIGKTLEKKPENTTNDHRTSIKNNGYKIESEDIRNRLNQILDFSLRESTIINEFKKFSEYIHNTQTLNQIIFSLLNAIIDYNVAGIFFNDRDEKKDKMLYVSANGVNLTESMQEHIRRNFFSQIFQQGFSRVDTSCCLELLDNSENVGKEVIDMDEFQSKTIIPITYLSKIIGGICLYNKKSDKFNTSRVFNIITEELKILMRLKWLHSETKYLAITDALTGLYNRRYFQQALEREIARAMRYKTDLSVVMVDIDFFKNVNDSYGHQFGDKVLAEIAIICKNKLRKTDYVARYGGEEFVAILPETNLKNAIIPFERIRKQIEEMDFNYGDEKVKVTISIGIASYDSANDNETTVLSKADTALYKAKGNGRNRIEF